ncbi:TIGR02556 family CRISPR-associated protein [Thermodesulfovibrionales bacterium]|nr:TIGR02556 family CRISPR-associated protein [Thermodesulfovibrionales bacterium]
MFTELIELNQIIEGGKPRNIVKRLNQGLPNAYKHGIAICFDLNSGRYVGLRLVEGCQDVVYMKASGSNGFAATALQPLAEKSASTINKLKRAVDALCMSVFSIKKQVDNITKNFDEIKILHEINVKLQDIPQSRDERIYLFVASIDGDKILPLYKEREVQEQMVKNALDEQYGKADKFLSIENDRTCYLCGKAGQKVYGNFSRLKCYNLDKRGVITGGFSYKEPLKNFPVCEECITAVSSGYDFAKKYLTFPICGERYILLPNLRTKNEELSDFILEKLQDRETATLSSKLEKITASENEILEELAEAGGGKDVLTLTMVFFEESNASWKITAEISEVLPSRITLIYKVKHTIESNRYLKMGENFYYTFRNLQRFMGDGGKLSRRKFMGYIDAIFADKMLDEKTFLTDLCRTILSTAKKEPKYLAATVRDAFATWLFLSQLKILRKGEKSMGNELIKTDGPYGQFIKKHEDFFNAHEKVVAFLTGCYISKVLYVQGTNLGNSPFFKKLRGLKLDKKKLEILYPESRNKIQQYDAFGLVKDIDSLIAQAWVDCGSKWDITDDEATLAFSIGLSLDYNIYKADEKKQ